MSLAKQSFEPAGLSLFRRIVSSVAALAIVWVSTAVAVGIHLRSAQGAIACLISSIPIFAIGWVVAGIPIVAAGRRVLQIPIWVIGLLGAVAGAIIFLGLDREDLIYLRQHLFGWPTLAAIVGAAAMVIYRLLIERRIKKG
jgi:lipid-A-disaccharide synthase-like uncharacterized protein